MKLTLKDEKREKEKRRKDSRPQGPLSNFIHPPTSFPAISVSEIISRLIYDIKFSIDFRG